MVWMLASGEDAYHNLHCEFGGNLKGMNCAFQCRAFDFAGGRLSTKTLSQANARMPWSAPTAISLKTGVCRRRFRHQAYLSPARRCHVHWWTRMIGDQWHQFSEQRLPQSALGPRFHRYVCGSAAYLMPSFIIRALGSPEVSRHYRLSLNHLADPFASLAVATISPLRVLAFGSVYQVNVLAGTFRVRLNRSSCTRMSSYLTL